jgi:uncharacterized protein
MTKQQLTIQSIPAIIWGPKSDRVYLFVHGKQSRKEEADVLAEIVVKKGYQVLSFDLPEHGERKQENYPCTAQNGFSDLQKIWNYVSKQWSQYALFACSLGAYFSLITYKSKKFDNVLFYSPVLDMERLINNMMKWFNVSVEELQEKKTIATPIGENLSWDYYQFVLTHRITQWNNRTIIIYGTNDNITERDVVDNFVKSYNCKLEIIKNGQHYFQSETELNALKKWISENS